MRYRWIAQHLRQHPGGARYRLYRPTGSYDVVVFLKSMSTACQRLAEALRRRGTRVIFDVNVDYFTAAAGRFYYRGMAPTEAQAANARRMAELSDALIADSSHLAAVCARHHRDVRWIPDNVDMRLAPAYRRWKAGAKLDLLWSGEAVKLFELLSIENVLRAFSTRIHLVLVTNDLAALERWHEPYRSRFHDLLAAVAHTIVPFESIGSLLKIYGRGGVFISPRFLDNTYNWGHTEWKITLPMACGRVALGSPLPSYRDVAARSVGGGLRICEDDAQWMAAFDAVLSGNFGFEAEEAAAREVVVKFYSTPIVAASHHEYVAEVCAAGC